MNSEGHCQKPLLVADGVDAVLAEIKEHISQGLVDVPPQEKLTGLSPRDPSTGVVSRPPFDSRSQKTDGLVRELVLRLTQIITADLMPGDAQEGALDALRDVYRLAEQAIHYDQVARGMPGNYSTKTGGQV